MAKATIVFVDDDNFYAMRWIEKLREYFVVQHFDDAENARRFILAGHDLRAIVLDIMMPVPSGASTEETAGGLDTGLWLLKRIGEHVRDSCVPVIVLTNRDSVQVAELVKKFGFTTDLVTVRSKTETNRERLLAVVRDKVTRWFGECP